jgi:hypothetical protein
MFRASVELRGIGLSSMSEVIEGGTVVEVCCLEFKNFLGRLEGCLESREVSKKTIKGGGEG